LYDITKAINFGLGYGAGPKRVMELCLKAGINCDMTGAKKIVEMHKELYSKTHEILDEIREDVITDEYSTTLGGRKRYFPHPNLNEIPITDKVKRYKVYRSKLHAYRREGGNHVIQGTGADMLKRALNLLRREIYKRNKQDELKLVLAPYDEIVCESKKNHEENQVMVQACMLLAQEHYQSLVPPAVEGKINKCWTK